MIPTYSKQNPDKKEVPGLFLCSWKSSGNLIDVEETICRKRRSSPAGCAYISRAQERSLTVPTCLSLREPRFPQIYYNVLGRRVKWLLLQTIFLVTSLEELELRRKDMLSQGMWTPAPGLLLTGHGVSGALPDSWIQFLFLRREGASPRFSHFQKVVPCML